MERLDAITEDDQRQLMTALCLRGDDETIAAAEASLKAYQAEKEGHQKTKLDLQAARGSEYSMRQQMVDLNKKLKWKRLTVRDPSPKELEDNPDQQKVVCYPFPNPDELVFITDGEHVWSDVVIRNGTPYPFLRYSDINLDGSAMYWWRQILGKLPGKKEAVKEEPEREPEKEVE
jgi:hypothetical protein